MLRNIVIFIFYMKILIFLYVVNVLRFFVLKSMVIGSGKMFCEVKCMLVYKVIIKLINSLLIK